MQILNVNNQVSLSGYDKYITTIIWIYSNTTTAWLDNKKGVDKNKLKDYNGDNMI